MPPGQAEAAARAARGDAEQGLADSLIRAGYVCILGRPNVGKSTLVNTLVGARLAAVSPRPQTSRYRILAVLHGEGFQAGLLDTPGRPAAPRPDALSRRMLRESRQAVESADLAVLMSAPRPPGDVERALLREIQERGVPAIAVVNKVDTVRKSAVLPVIQAWHELYDGFREIIPVSARTEDGLDVLLQRIAANLPLQAPLFDPAALTDRSEAFLISELIREGVFTVYGDEVPYATAVEIEAHSPNDAEHGGKDYIEACVYVERDSQRGILVGRGGRALKAVGVRARPGIEELLGRPVMLRLWARTRPRWRRDERFLRALED